MLLMGIGVGEGVGVLGGGPASTQPPVTEQLLELLPRASLAKKVTVQSGVLG